MELSRLLEPGSPLTPVAAAEELRLVDRAHAQRPYVVLNMVSSLDGHATVEGRSAPMSSEADRRLFHALREQVDAVLAGTVTLATEGYRRLIRDPERRAARVAAGLAADPLAVVLSRSGRLPSPAEAPLLGDPDQPSVSFEGADAEPAVALRRLRTEHGVRALLCEGGPTLAGGLLRAGVVDELMLTLSPLLVGGGTRLPIVGGDTPPQRLALDRVLEHEGALFLRYRVAEGSS